MSTVLHIVATAGVLVVLLAFALVATAGLYVSEQEKRRQP